MQQEALRYLMSNATSAWQNQIGWVRISVFIALLTEGHNSPAKGKNVSRNTPSQTNVHTDPTNKIPSDVTPCAYSEKELKHIPGSKCCNQHVKRIRHNPAVTTIQLLSQTRNARLPNQMPKHSSQNGTTNQRRPLTSKLSNTRVPHQTHRHWLKPSTIFSDVTRHKALHRFKLIIARRVHMSHCAQHPLHHNVRHWAHRPQLTRLKIQALEIRVATCGKSHSSLSYKTGNEPTRAAI